MSINSDAIDAVNEGINRVGIIDSEVQICANCGKEGSDVTNSCNKCNSVMYCNAACKKKHRHKHKKQCEEHVRRAAENAAKEHDEKLFKKPPQVEEDCPICFLRMPLLGTGKMYMACCGKTICCGCMYAPVYDNQGNEVVKKICPFCRTPLSTSNEEISKRLKKRVKLNDAEAIFSLASFYSDGELGLPRSYAKAFELFHQAGELGNAAAYYNVGNAYKFGRGVEVDERKAIYYWELGAMGGDPYARCNLGCEEGNLGNMDRALKHWMIATKNGEALSLQKVKKLYSNGYATKDEYAKALRSYQVYLDEIKSEQRDEAAAADDDKYYESTF